MRIGIVLAGTAALAAGVLTTAALAAPHGKAGLWTIVTVNQMTGMPQLPPQAIQMMKQRGIPMPGDPITSQVCLTEAQAARTTPPNLDRSGEQCTSHIVSQTASSVVTDMACHGHMEGTGHLEISWRGDGHYEGDYSFRGNMGGRSQAMTSHYTGDWVKADCGAVKPFDEHAPR